MVVNESVTRRVVLGGAAVVGVSTAATSAVSLYGLARLCGIPEYLAAALPIALDAGAAVAALVWVTEQGALRKWGCGVALAGLIATLGGNAASHIYTEHDKPPMWLILCVGASIPAMLFAVVHLSAMLIRPPTKKTGKATDPRPARTSSPSPSAPAGPITPPVITAVTAAPVPEKPEAWARRNWPVAAKDICAQYPGLNPSWAYKVVRKIKAEMERVAAELEPVQ
jgi:hypothetical protein